VLENTLTPVLARGERQPERFDNTGLRGDAFARRGQAEADLLLVLELAAIVFHIGAHAVEQHRAIILSLIVQRVVQEDVPRQIIEPARRELI